MRLLPTTTMLLAVAWSAAAQSYTPESFASELKRLEAGIDQGNTVTSDQLPQQWTVSTDTRTYSIPTQPLRNLLDGSNPQAVRAWIAQMERQAESFTGGAAHDDKKDLLTLEAILARPEFKKAHEPSALERFNAQIQAWIQNWLNRIFTYAAQHPTGSQFLFWTLIVGSVAALGGWILHLFADTNTVVSSPGTAPLDPKFLSWQEWLAQAREAASAGDHHQAIRYAYWAGIARLQLDRSIRINFSDTPRERLRLLEAPSKRGELLSVDRLQPLKEITQSFERCWYAQLPASGEDVTRALKNLESLGCRTS